MRISSQMLNTSLTTMQSSDVYKRYTNKIEEEDKTEDTADTKHITENVVVEKSDDTFILSKIDEFDQKTILDEIKANTQIGIELNKYFKTDETTELQDNMDLVNQTIKSMSLADYI